MRTFKRAVAGLVGAAAMIGAAWAQSFDGDDIEGFIAVIKGAEAIGEKYEDTDIPMPKGYVPEDMASLDGLLDDEGQFRVFRLSTEAMSRAPAHPAITDYKNLVTSAGFSGLPAFGEKADAIMMAYLALEMAGEEMDLGGLTPEMMAMMPPAARAQMAPVLRMMEAVQNVPAADIDALRPYEARLNAAFDG